ncbi:hypothetical protein FRC17_005847 [Serendipita sp. 399]|nr:hypothetical protein FRC17_005847 [Serendipita sp. 399]
MKPPVESALDPDPDPGVDPGGIKNAMVWGALIEENIIGIPNNHETFNNETFEHDISVGYLFKHPGALLNMLQDSGFTSSPAMLLPHSSPSLNYQNSQELCPNVAPLDTLLDPRGSNVSLPKFHIDPGGYTISLASCSTPASAGPFNFSYGPYAPNRAGHGLYDQVPYTLTDRQLVQSSLSFCPFTNSVVPTPTVDPQREVDPRWNLGLQGIVPYPREHHHSGPLSDMPYAQYAHPATGHPVIYGASHVTVPPNRTVFSDSATHDSPETPSESRLACATSKGSIRPASGPTNSPNTPVFSHKAMSRSDLRRVLQSTEVPASLHRFFKNREDFGRIPQVDCFKLASYTGTNVFHCSVISITDHFIV